MKVFLLLYIRLLTFKHRIAHVTQGRNVIKPVIFFLIGLVFWSGTFFIFCRVLAYFQGIEVLGDFLAAKLLSMVMLTFFSLLLFSNVITALSTFYLAQDLQLLFPLPFTLGELYYARLLDTTLNSSWMVLLFGFPVFLAYGAIYHAPVLFYVFCLLVLIPFIVIASSLGVIITMGLVNIFPARRTRDVLFLLSILSLVFLYLLFRFLNPENLVDPEQFTNLIDYFASLKSFSSPALPSSWATESLLAVLLPSSHGDGYFYLLMLWSTGAGLLVTGDWMASRCYVNGVSKAQESRRTTFFQTSLFNLLIDFILRPFRPPTRAMIEKDFKIFFRDTTQWSQLLLLVALVIVYLYNFKALPLDKAPIASFYLQNLLSFLNLGLAGFVLAAIAVRFVFPAVSMEGQAFWIILAAPLSLKKFLLNKFFLSLIPLLCLAEILTVVTNHLLKVTNFMMLLSLATIFFMTFGIVSLGVGMGAVYPRFKHSNAAEISTGFGGMLYMMYAIGLIGATVVLEARPVYILFMSFLKKATLSGWFYGELLTALVIILVLNAAALILPLRYGLKNLCSLENLE